MSKVVNPMFSTTFSQDGLKGKWYELCRQANRFERGMTEVLLYFSWTSGDCIDLLHVGKRVNKKRIHNFRGRIYHASDYEYVKFRYGFRSIKLKILCIDEPSGLVLISDVKSKYFWILTNKLPVNQDDLNVIIEEAKNLGFNTDCAIFMKMVYDIE